MATRKIEHAAPLEAASAPAIAPQSEILQRSFEEGRKVQEVISAQMAAPVKKGLQKGKLAEAAFANWSPQSFAQSKRAAGTYLTPGLSLADAIGRSTQRGIEKMRANPNKSPIKLQMSPRVKNAITRAAGPNGVIGTIPVSALVPFFPPSLKNEPNPTECSVEEKLAQWIKEVEGEKPEVGEPGVDAGGGNPANNALPDSKELVKQRVNTLMEALTSPESLPTLNLPSRASLSDAAKALQTFELRAGPSDVTSYHDFRSVQIAFEHVWTEIFDDRLKGLGAHVYQLYIEHLADFGAEDKREPITSIEDLKRLVNDIEQLGNVPAVSEVAAATGTGMPGGALFDVIAPWYAEAKRRYEEKKATEEKSDVAAPVPTRLWELLEQIKKILAKKYSFTVFAPDSYNFGIIITYRQKWTPVNYQVGDLVSTIPLAPREVLRYTTKRISKKTRSVKELEDNLRTTKTESNETSRVEREILAKAEEKSSFHLGAHESLGGDQYYQIESTQDQNADQAKMSAETKTHFHEAVLKSAQEYRQQNRMEIETSASDESEDTTFREIQNPNDELPVTYLFYELQRTYKIQEKIHQLQSVIFVANEVPAPDAIDDAWLIAHDWIIRRVILDDSFKPAIEYLTKSFVGAELNIQILDNNAKAQKVVVDRITQQVQNQDTLLSVQARDLASAVNTVALQQGAQSATDTVKRIFDPLGLTGKADTGVAAGQTLVDFMQETFDRSEREKVRLLTELGVATTALQSAIDKLSAAIRAHYDRVAEVDRLRIHVKENILYYMQAIWSHEPPDQRFFRVYDIDVSIIEPDPDATVPVIENAALIEAAGGPPAGYTNAMWWAIMMNMPPVVITTKKLVEIADLDTVLGYKGNYAIYPLKKPNLITAHMSQSYAAEMMDEMKLRDPDEFANYTLDELKEWAACLYRRDKDTYDKRKDEFAKLIKDRLMSGRPEDDLVVVPTTSLYIEALVGTHPLLEDFKLAHRAIDVRKAQADVRHSELENIRLAARATEGQFDDPEVEKKIIIQGNASAIVPGE
jgi:hypothetical protein